MRAIVCLAATLLIAQCLSASPCSAQGHDEAQRRVGSWWDNGASMSNVSGAGGFGGYGGGMIGGWQGAWGGDTNSSYYYSPAQTSLPAPAAQDAVDVEEKMANRVPHHEGPSMSFDTSDAGGTTDTFAMFNRDWNQIAGPVQYQPRPVRTNVSAQLRVPTVTRRLPVLKNPTGNGGSVSFDSGGAGFSADVQAKLTGAQNLLSEYVGLGRLGTFDIENLQKRLDELKDQARNAPDAAAQTQLINDIGKLEFEIRSHSGN